MNGFFKTLGSYIPFRHRDHKYHVDLPKVDLPNYFAFLHPDFKSGCFIEISPSVGCPVICKDCPQSTFMSVYRQVPNRPLRMAFSDFKGIVDRAPERAMICFAGVAEPFTNPACTDMIEYALSQNKGPVSVFATMAGMTIDNYRRFMDHPNLTFVLHLPDAQGATKFAINDRYLQVLEFVLTHKPASFRFSLHGENEHPAISHLVRYSQRSFMHDRAGNVTENDVVSVPTLKGPIRCGHWWLDTFSYGSGLVLPDGTTIVCSMDWSLSYVIGNAFKQSFLEMTSSEKYRQCLESCRDDRVDSICRHCCFAQSTRPVLGKNWIQDRMLRRNWNNKRRSILTPTPLSEADRSSAPAPTES